MQNDTHARTYVTDVELPASLTDPLPEDASTLTIAARTAAVTALGVDGVHHLGSLVERAADQVRSRIGRAGSALGVTVDDADTALDVRVSLVVEYPRPVTAVAEEVRSQVTRAVSQSAERPARVEVHVTDVHGPFDDEPSVIDRASDAVKDATDQVRAASSGAADQVRVASSGAADQVRSTASDVSDRVRARSGPRRSSVPRRPPPLPPTRRSTPPATLGTPSPTLRTRPASAPLTPSTPPPTRPTPPGPVPPTWRPTSPTRPRTPPTPHATPP